METWQQLLKNSLTKPEDIAARFGLPIHEVRRLNKSFKTCITSYYADLIKEKDDPLYRQMVPDSAELEGTGDSDPLSEENDSPVPGLVHRYPDRVLFLISPVCASYCRFCTRKRKVGDASRIHPAHVKAGIEYIREHNEIRDVILSGGDPLMLSNRRIESILRQLRSIPHVEILRIGTRMPCVLPQRVTPELAGILKKYHPLFMNVHFNHPDELTKEAVKALGILADAGIPLGNQTVLLKGVNDDPAVMKELVRKLVLARVRPYYIYQADYVKGTEHLRTRVEKGMEIMEALRGWTSGIAVPQFVIDAPGGGGKIPLLPNYVLSFGDDIILRNYQGKIFIYPQTDGEENIMNTEKQEMAAAEML